MLHPILSEFREFLKVYKVTGLAVAFIIGSASIALVTSLVNNIIMPVIGILVPSGDWQTATFYLGSAKIVWGAFLSSLINFAIIAVIVFAVYKSVPGRKKARKK